MTATDVQTAPPPEQTAVAPEAEPQAPPAPQPQPQAQPAVQPQPQPQAQTQGQQQYYYGLGRRKCAIAQVRLFPGEGNIVINGRPSSEYFGRETLDLIVQEPLRTVEGAAFNVVAKVIGGGRAGQAGAIRLGIARALVVADETNRRLLRSRGLLTRDARVKERKKPGLRRARRAKQFTKR
jgi:small subunit ribosomal protein S9